MKILYTILVAALLVTPVACSHSAPTVSATTPVVTVTQAQKAVAVLDVLRDTAVSMNAQTPPLLSNQATAEVVKIHQSVVAAIEAAPTGWKNTVLTTLAQLQTDLSAVDYAKISPYVIVAIAAISAIQS